MVKKIKLYVEGATQDSELSRSICRQAFSTFFQNAKVEKRPQVVPCGGRQNAFNNFERACRTAEPGVLPLLLVDSEDEIAPGQTVWAHLNSRVGDGWVKPKSVPEDTPQAFLMVQVMETWFLADPDKLEEHFGKGFKRAAIKKWPDLEKVSKPTVYDSIKSATSECASKAYSKGDDSFKLLAKIRPEKVEAASPHAKRLFDRLREL